MAAKKAKVKAKARRVAPSAKGKGTAKAPRAKAKARPPVVAKAPRVKGKPRPKRKATRTKSVQRPAAELPQMELFASEQAAATEPLPKTKKGPLARLASGVGSLFARVTGKSVTDPDPSQSPEQTLELSSTDILAATAAPPPPPKPKR